MQALELMEQLIKGCRSRPQLAGSVGLAENVVLCYSQENKQLLLNKEVKPHHFVSHPICMQSLV